MDAVPPAGHLRVVASTGAAECAEPYVQARARVVRVGSAALGAFHAVVPALTDVRPDDADLVLWDGQASLALDVLASRLAPAGVVVAPASRARALADAGLRIAPATDPSMVLAIDRRPVPQHAAALFALDRTACVDRARVLEVLERGTWSAPAGDPSVDAQDLLDALLAQLRVGEPDVRALPWPRLRTSSEGAVGCDVLVVTPHPDDESIHLGGTIAGLVRAGRRVHLVVATDGAGGRGGDGLAARRAAELIEACAVLGVRAAACLAWPDTGKYRDAARTQPLTAADAIEAWGLHESMGQLVASIRRHRPCALLSLDPELDPNLSLHGHHLALGVLLCVAVHLAGCSSYRPELGAAWTVAQHRVAASPHVGGADTEVVCIDAASKRRAVSCHRSQGYSTQRLLGGAADDEAVEHTRVLQRRPGADASWMVVAPGEDVGSAFEGPAGGWRAHAQRVLEAPRERAAVVQVLRRQAASLPHDPARDASLRTLERPDSVVVCAGQQVGWLGGPALTLVKALAAVELAARLRCEGVRAVPVFWMATQDHDLDEVTTAPTLEDPSVRVPVEGRGAPVGALRLPADVAAAHDAWRSVLPDPLRTRAASIPVDRPGSTLAEAFAARLAALTEGTGLLLLDPLDPGFARLAASVLARDLLGERPAGAVLRRAPGPVVVPVDRDVSQVFMTDDAGRRQRITRTEAGARVGDRCIDAARLERLLQGSPERFSPAALLRPVVQDALLPVVATVAGPTEARYLAQMRPLYAWADVVPSWVVRRPLLRPRRAEDLAALEDLGGFEALRRDARPLRTLGARGLPGPASRWLSRCRALDHALLELRPWLASEGVPVALLAEWARLRDDAEEALRGLRVARAWPGHRDAIENHLRTASSRGLTRAARRLYQLRRSLLRDGRRRAMHAVRALARLERGAERQMTVAELEVRHGPDLVPALRAAMASLGTRTIVLTTGGS